MTDNPRRRNGVWWGMNASTLTGQRARSDGGAEDFETWVLASAGRHRRLAYLLCGDLTQAEDLLQESYAKVLPKWQRVQEYDAPDAYLRKVMVNLRTSWWRRSRGREIAVADPIEREHTPDPADEIVDNDRLLTALAGLTDRQRAAVVLRHWSGLSEAETAAAMNCSLGTVKSTTSKGLANLRRALGEDTQPHTPGTRKDDLR